MDKKVGKYGTEEISIGVPVPDLDRLIREKGWASHIADFLVNPATDYEDFVYPLVESGFPTILGVDKPGFTHVMAVLGHTLNTDRWTPHARHRYGSLPLPSYISTCAWADHFIVGDDNLGMYVTIPTEAIRNILVPKHNPNLHASLAVGISPAGISLSGISAEQAAAMLGNKIISLSKEKLPKNRWFALLKEEGQMLTCRTLLVEKDSYLHEMKHTSDEQGRRLGPSEISMLENSLPSRFWLTELTVPNLYVANKRKLGDVITAVQVDQDDYKTLGMVRLCWLPGILWKSSGGSHVPQEWPLLGHIPLFRRRSSNPTTLEW